MVRYSLAFFLIASCFTTALQCSAVKAISSSTSMSALPEVGELFEETGFYQSIRLFDEPPLFTKQSAFQRIEVVRSPYYGKVLVLDGVLQLTERDANAYNEMMAHLPMFQHRSPKRVLVIGGGDGYVLSEVLKHESVLSVDHVDLDVEVIETCRKFFAWGDAWKDPRVTLHIADGAEFVRNAPTGYYDVIVQDSSDPWGWDESGNMVELPSKVLYAREHFQNLYRILGPDGILNIQAETLQIPSDFAGATEWRQTLLDVGFSSSRYGSILISSYPTGQIGFLMSEKNPDLSTSPRDIQQRFAVLKMVGKPISYYHPRLQVGAFDLPYWAEQQMYGDETIKSVCDNPSHQHGEIADQ